MKKKKTLLVVSPKGVPVKAFNLNIFLMAILLLFIGFGLAGFFIPYQKFSLNKQEIQQKKNLSEQNKALLKNIKTTIGLLNNLKEKLLKLEEKQKSVLQFGIIGSDTTIIPIKRVAFNEMTSRELLAYITSQESYVKKFVQYVKKDGNFFDNVPVIYPVPNGASVSRQFGNALDPFTGKNKFHYGVDFVAEKGIGIVVPASGVVEKTEKHPVWGLRTIINHGNGYKTVFAHVGELKVHNGQSVKKGELLGFVGISGLTSGPHVHYELRYKNDALDPGTYFFPSKLF
jgi:murein DD-endopeptidase MepM/ murein hydrolase activator NlpD